MSLPWVRMRSTNSQPSLAELFFALGIPEQVLAALADRNVGVHAAAVDADHGLGQEGGGQSQIARDLAADQLVELDLVGGSHHFRVAVVDFELRRRHLGVILFVLEAHGALHFGGRIDEGAQRIAGQRVIVAAGVHVFELARLVVGALGVRPLEQEAFDFVGRVQGVAVLLVQAVRERLEDAAHVGGVGLAALVDDFAEHQHLAGAKNVGRRPVEGAPVDAQAQIAFPLRGKAANRGTVEGQVVVALQQKFLVVVEHVQAAFEVAEHDGHGLDALLVGQILQPLFLNFVEERRGPGAASSPSDSSLPVRRRGSPENSAIQLT